MLVDVLVAPRASRNRLGPVVGDRLRVAVTAPPVDGEANEAVIRAVADALRVPKKAVEIVRGQRGRRKTLRVRGITLAAMRAAIGP